MVLAMAVVLSSALIATAFFQMDVSLNFDNVKVARNMADSAVAIAAQQVMADYASGSPSATWTPADVVISGPTGGALLPSPGYDVGGQLERDSPMKGVVTFNKNQTATPYSTDNLYNTNGVPGYSSASSGSTPWPVPGNGMQLIGVGTYKNTTVYTNAIIWIPPYPYAIAASGKININGNVVVGSVGQNGANATAGGSLVPTSSLLPAAMGDSNTGAPAISMSPGNGSSVYIAGCVDTAGTVYQNGSIVINGQLMQNVSAGSIPIPTVTVTSFNPVGTIPNSQITTLTPTPCGVPTNLQLTGYNFVSPSATYTTQNINLNGGILYVKGSLQAQTVSGNGAIMAEGNVTITQDANLTSNDTLALLANGNVNLNGTCQSGSTFKGLLYTQGNLSAKNLTVIGQYVANGGTTNVGNVSLCNSNVIVSNCEAVKPSTWPSATPQGSSSATTVSVTPSSSFSPGQFNPCGCVGHITTYTLCTSVKYYCGKYHVTINGKKKPGCTSLTAVCASFAPPLGCPPPACLVSAYAGIYKNYGHYSCAVANLQGKLTAKVAVNTYLKTLCVCASKLTRTCCTTVYTTPSPAVISASPFSFNNFLSNATTNSRVLMWQSSQAWPNYTPVP
jgi:hypothetical protein